MTKGVQLAVALALPLVLLIGNVQLLAHPRFIHYEYAKAGFPPDTAIPPGGYRLSEMERTDLAMVGLGSIIGPEGIRVLEEARFQETKAPAFNSREIQHMRDVRWLFQQARVISWVALAVLLGGGVFLTRRDGHRLLTPPLLASVIVTLAGAGALGLYIVLNFNSFFTRFHHTFFAGETWLFRRDDTLIRLYPTDFWFDAAFIIAGLTVLELAAVGLGAWWVRKRGDAGKR